MASPEELETFTALFREQGLDAAIDSVARRQPPAPACAPFLRRVCEALEVTPQQLLYGGRCKSLANARHIAMWVCREATGASYPEIGKALGGMDHTSVMHGVRRVDKAPRLFEQALAILDRTPGFTSSRG
jgi:hypothetical protein